MRILWVKVGSLYPLDTGGKKRSHAMLRELSKEHEVTYLGLRDPSEDLTEEEKNDPYAKKKEWVDWRAASKNSLAFGFCLLFNFISSLPYALAKYRSVSLQERLHSLARENRFDLIVCDFLAPAMNFAGHIFRAPVVLFQHNMEAQIWKRMAESQKSWVRRSYFSSQWRRMKAWEGKLSTAFRGVITVSPEDTRHAREEYGLPNVLGDVPTGVDVSHFAIPGESVGPVARGGPFTIGFLGSMDWMPNIDAVEYFVAEILPLVRRDMAKTRLKIIGRNPTAGIRALAHGGEGRIEVTGTVEDVRPHVRECHVIVVPLRAGGGTRIKIFEAMAMGVPVVSTTIGAEGLPVTHGEDILLADDSVSFAEALKSVARDPVQAVAIAAQAREKVERDHSWASATKKFMNLCQPILVG